MAKELNDIPKFKRSFWKKIGDKVADSIRIDTTKKGIDVNGRIFKPYKTHPPFWFSKKVKGKTISIYAEDYKTRKSRGGMKRQSSTSTKPDLQLTGDMMRNLQTRGFTKNNAIIGWSGTNAQKVEWNANMGREVTTDTVPISKKNQNFVLKMISNKIEKNIKDATKQPLIIRIGK